MVFIVGISTACFYPLYTEKTLPIIADMGFKKIEVFLNSDGEFSLDYILSLKNFCDEHDMSIGSVHPFTSFAEPQFFFSNYARRYSEGIELYKKYFFNSAAIGANIFNLHGAFLGQNVSVDQYADIYFELRAVAKKEGILLSQENVSRCLSGKLEFLCRLSDLLKDDISFTLDIKQANRAGEDPIVMAEKIGKKVVLCHINDFDKEKECILPCMGSFDLSKLKSKLNANGYRGDYIIEVYSHNYSCFEDIKQSKTRLEGIINN